MGITDVEITEEQIAEAEAEVESFPIPELRDDEPEPEDEPEPDPEPGPTPEVAEKAFKRVERSFTSYASGAVKDLVEVTGLPLEPCPLCPSQHKGFIDMSQAGAMPQEIKDVTMYYLGFPREQEYEADATVRTCDTCGGKGKTATGSRVPGNETIVCGKCRGYGYYPPPTGPGQPGAAATDVHAPAGEQPLPLAQDEVDVSGEPRYLPDGRPNPNFGMWPQYKIEVPPYGVTVNLTAQDRPA